MTTGDGLVTAEQLEQLPRGTWRYELLKGELRRMSPSGFEHGRIAARVAVRLGSFVEQHGLGETCGAETGFLLRRHPDTVRAPDAGFISAATLAAHPAPIPGFFPGAPDVAVEVRSPSDRDQEVLLKVADWIEAGTCAVLVLDPEERTATLHRPDGIVTSFDAAGDVTLPDILPGWSLRLSELFG